MKLWEIPGARRFVDSTCQLLRDGSNVVVVFPGKVPAGFETTVTADLGDILDTGVVRCGGSPLHTLANRYATCPDRIRSIPDLCDDPGFRGKLVQLRGLDASNWPPWREFLTRLRKRAVCSPCSVVACFWSCSTGLPLPSHRSPTLPSPFALGTACWTKSTCYRSRRSGFANARKTR